MNAGAIVGLIMFVLGIILLLVWGTNMEQNVGWFFPGLLLAGGGFVVMWLFGRGGSGGN